jgi:hypothetical protein
VSEPSPSSPAPAPLRAAAVIVGVEAVALVAAALVLVIRTIADPPGDVLRPLFVAVGALLGAALLAYAARGLLRLRASARSPVVVLQILALPVGWTAAFDAHRPLVGAPILVAALAVLYLLFSPPARTALNRE